MTPQPTVLEKLKRINEAQIEWKTAPISELVHKERYFDGILRMFAFEDLPNLIKALELIEGNAQRSTIIYDSTEFIERVRFSKQVYALLEGKK